MAYFYLLKSSSLFCSILPHPPSFFFISLHPSPSVAPGLEVQERMKSCCPTFSPLDPRSLFAAGPSQRTLQRHLISTFPGEQMLLKCFRWTLKLRRRFQFSHVNTLRETNTIFLFWGLGKSNVIK